MFYTKWGLILASSIVIAIAGCGTQDIRCTFGLKAESCVGQEVELITQTETGSALGGVKIQYTSQGAPEVQFTDSNGYAKVKIPSQGDVRVILTKEGYPTQDFNINLKNEQPTTRIIRFTASGKPIVASSPSTTSTADITSTPPNPPDVVSQSSLLDTECQTATAGASLDQILVKLKDSFSVTLGRETLPLFAYMQSYYNSSYITLDKPVEFVCNLKSNYKELKLVFGVHGGNNYALPQNKLLFQVFLDNKPVARKEVAVGAKQELSLNLSGVKNVSLRAECNTQYCPALSFTEMSLK